MGQRVIYPVDLLDLDRRRRYEAAAERNGLKLSKWLREVADAAAERRFEAPVVSAVWLQEQVAALHPDEDLELVAHVHSPKALPWGGRQCEGCGDLL